VSPAAARRCLASSVRRLRPSRGRPGSSSRRPSSGRAERRSGIAGDVVQHDARQRPGVPVRDEEPVTLELEDGAARRAVEETRLRPMVRAGAPEESLQAAHAARRLARDRSDGVEVAPEDVRAPEPGAVEERAVDGDRRVADDEYRAGGGEADDGCVPDAVGAGDVQLEYRRQVERAQQAAVGRYQQVLEAAAHGRAGEGARVRGLARSAGAGADGAAFCASVAGALGGTFGATGSGAGTDAGSGGGDSRAAPSAITARHAAAPTVESAAQREARRRPGSGTTAISLYAWR